MLNHHAYFDSLSICNQLSLTLEKVAQIEVHLFAYLACLLSLYKKQPASAWEYKFGVTEQGYAFSSDIQRALNVLINNGRLVVEGEYVQLTQTGIDEYVQLKALFQYSQREPFIEGACSSALAMPLGMIRDAISQEVDIKRAITLSQSRMLLTEMATNTLYEQFQVLSDAIGVNIQDLMVPAVVWLNYLAQHSLP